MTEHDELDIDEILDRQALPEESVPICLRGDLIKELAALDRQLSELNAESLGDDKRLTGNPEARRIAEQYDEVKAEADRFTVAVLLRAVNKKAWKDLKTKHPGGKDQDFDPDRLFADLIPMSVVSVNGKVLPATKLDRLIEGLTEGQFDQLAGAAWALNAGEGRAPKSVLASKVRRNSGETSKQPATGE